MEGAVSKSSSACAVSPPPFKTDGATSGALFQNCIIRMKPDEKKALLLASLLLAATFFFVFPRLCFVDYNPPVLILPAAARAATNGTALAAAGNGSGTGHDPLGRVLARQRQIQSKEGEQVAKKSRVQRGEDHGEKSTETEEEECNLFEGRWVRDEEYPLYESRDCPFMDEGFRCSENGRADRDYTKWRWQPSGCNLPRFNAKDMLEKLRGKRVVIVGDSIGRNQWESLLCMLSSVIADKSSVYEVNGNPITKHMGFLAFKFSDYNATVEYYRAPFLVLHSRAPPGAPKEVAATLKLDLMDYTANQWKDADMLIFNTGHWWSKDKTVNRGHYFQEGSEVKMEMSVQSAYERSIRTVLEWIHREVNTTKSQVYFRTYAPVHFRFGDWKTGGSCHLETLPELNSSAVELNSWSHLLSPLFDASLEHSDKVAIRELELLNITYMTALRKDAHLSLYYLGPNKQAPIHRQDCSHWCLPGVPDTWNEILYALFLRRERALTKRE